MTSTTNHHTRRLRLLASTAALCAALVAALAGASAAEAEYRITSFTTGTSDTQAGGHPDVTTRFTFPVDGNGDPDGHTRRIEVDTPLGLVGDPAATPKCHPDVFIRQQCPPETQVGVVDAVELWGLGVGDGQVYNLQPARDEPALLGLILDDFVTSLVHISVLPDGGLKATVDDLPYGASVLLNDMTLWGVPADHNGGGGERRPFMIAPTQCEDVPTTKLSGLPYGVDADWVSASSSDPVPTGCDSLTFEPEIDVSVDNPRPDSPSGVSVSVSLPHNSNPDGVVGSHLEDAVVTLPEGMTMNPSAASGLVGCSDEQIGLDDVEPARCPAASRVGTVTIDTPLLEDPMTGHMFVGTQRPEDPYRIFVEAYGHGARIKLHGSVSADPVTGQLTTRFLDNPQLPFTKMTLAFRGGPRAPLATPPTCGVKTVTSRFFPYSGGPVATPSDSFTIRCPGMAGFAPDLTAGTISPIAGAFSPFALRLERPDGQEYIDGIHVELPDGLLADVRDVWPLCTDTQAAANACPASSRIGTATVGSGTGSDPFYLQGGVFLTEGYKGAPYGLSIAVRVLAGPFDLGTVIVRQAVRVDPDTTEIRVESDPVPTILEGIPVRLRTIQVDADRPGLIVNPTSCDDKQVHAYVHSQQGTLTRLSERFQAADCAALPYRPRMRMRLLGRKQRRTNGNPALRAVLRQTDDQANVAKARVVLPRSIALDPDNSNDPDLLCDYDAGWKRADCPESTIIGHAVAKTPILRRPLRGPVHMIQGIRIAKSTGNRIRTTPHLLVKLDGEVQINLRAKTTSKNGLLITRFLTVPDAPVSRFALRVKGGSKGILEVTRTRKGDIDLCDSRQTAKVQTKGQNGRNARFKVDVRTPCARKGRKAKRGAKAKAKAKRQAAKRRAGARRAAGRSGR